MTMKLKECAVVLDRSHTADAGSGVGGASVTFSYRSRLGCGDDRAFGQELANLENTHVLCRLVY